MISAAGAQDDTHRRRSGQARNAARMVVWPSSPASVKPEFPQPTRVGGARAIVRARRFAIDDRRSDEETVADTRRLRDGAGRRRGARRQEADGRSRHGWLATRRSLIATLVVHQRRFASVHRRPRQLFDSRDR